ncbi:tight adherence pilus pseudopilin TadF [Pasteurella canis]|uniref:tight adherence pilus pseudopilin TadF n=1 Tax=Pasteurella canis TaxID=753 RepID=UPI000D9CAE37|nr:tight adherence pilus pseudopilin TadF [Pasteurella canis]SPY32953.1 proteinTadF [Pasteurella canis]
MKKLGLFRIKRFLQNKEGSVTIEFLFMSMFLLILFAFLFDLVMLRSTLGKLDNASYTMVSILRERSQLYNRAPQINEDDYRQFEKLAKRLLYGNKDSNKKVGLVLEYWAQDGSGRSIPSAVGNCKPYKKLADLSYLSPRSELNNERKIPLYQVTLCVETHSLFESLLLDESQRSSGLMRSSSMSVSR